MPDVRLLGCGVLVSGILILQASNTARGSHLVPMFMSLIILCMDTYKYIIHVCIHLLYMYIYMHMLCVCIYIHIDACVYVWIHILIYIHI